MRYPYYSINKKILKLYKTKCIICGEDAKCCLEFHHVSTKLFNISLSVKNTNPDLFKSELDKCVCICSNCHKKLHAGLIKL